MGANPLCDKQTDMLLTYFSFYYLFWKYLFLRVQNVHFENKKHLVFICTLFCYTMMMHMWYTQNLRRHFYGGFSYYFCLWKLATWFCWGCLSPAMYFFPMGLFGGQEQVARQGGDCEEGSVWNWCIVFYHLSSFVVVESISVAIGTFTPCRYKVKWKLDNRRTDRK